jgi:hypothetical protein
MKIFKEAATQKKCIFKGRSNRENTGMHLRRSLKPVRQKGCSCLQCKYLKRQQHRKKCIFKGRSNREKMQGLLNRSDKRDAPAPNENI